MREEFGDIWEMGARPNSVVCITTNGYVNSRGECVMGRGVAKQAKGKYPGIAKVLGGLIRTAGNHVHWIGRGLGEDDQHVWLFSFPTKHVWWRPSQLDLIRQSAAELVTWANSHTDLTFYLPRPGCQNGGLRWAEVKPVLEDAMLPDNVVVVTNDPTQWEVGKCPACGLMAAEGGPCKHSVT